jgi:hypothetical protein
MNNKKKCFVIMPISTTQSGTEQEWTGIFKGIIKPAVEESGYGYNCERYELRRANITKDILDELNNAHVVIADLTGSNPNVLWELGVRHTLSKRTILIAQDKRFLPSDLKDYPIILYKYKQTPAEVDKFRQDIKDKLEDIEADPEKPDSPVADFLQVKNIDLLAYEKTANLRKMGALISELSYDATVVDELIGTVKSTQQTKKGQEEKSYATTWRFANTCLELLVSTGYIALPKELLHKIRKINRVIGSVNRSLELWQEFGNDVERNLLRTLPILKKSFIEVLEGMNRIKLDYENNNYQEPKEPIIELADPEHEKYLKQLG